MNECIVCAVDDTDHGFTVARTAERLRRALDLRMVLVHVAVFRGSAFVPSPAALPSTLAPEQLPPAEMGTASDAEVDSAQSVLERIADAELLLGAELRPERSDPSMRILAVADEVDAELIVVGSRRRGSLATMFLGSVSHAVVSGAACPVVIVPHGGEVRTPWALDSTRMH
jgi:nucleotide-binding universal stress UspA family protein